MDYEVLYLVKMIFALGFTYLTYHKTKQVINMNRTVIKNDNFSINQFSSNRQQQQKNKMIDQMKQKGQDFVSIYRDFPSKIISQSDQNEYSHKNNSSNKQTENNIISCQSQKHLNYSTKQSSILSEQVSFDFFDQNEKQSQSQNSKLKPNLFEGQNHFFEKTFKKDQNKKKKRRKYCFNNLNHDNQQKSFYKNQKILGKKIVKMKFYKKQFQK